MSENTQATLRLFIHTLGNARFIFKDGKVAHFLNGEYRTGIPSEIRELEAEVASKDNPYITVDTNRLEVPAVDENPIEVIRRKAVEDYLKSQAAALDKTKESESDTNFQLRVTNSDDVAGAMSGSTSIDGAGGVVGASVAEGATGTATLANAVAPQTGLAARLAAAKTASGNT